MDVQGGKESPRAWGERVKGRISFGIRREGKDYIEKKHQNSNKSMKC